MIIRSRAPLRIGFAGGGTDVSPYSDMFGGAILNATIDLYAYTTIFPKNDGKIVFNAKNNSHCITLDAKEELPLIEGFELFIGIYNRLIKQFNLSPLSFELTSHIDAPQGSGLGTSSTIVVSVLGAFVEWLNLPLGKYDIAHLAYEIERIDLNMAGGKQDQYAATFGGVNFIEFFKDDKVIVNPLQIRQEELWELEYTILLYFTATQRHSAHIIDTQVKNVKQSNTEAIEAMHNLKKQAYQMKEALLKNELTELGKILHYGWMNKKKMSNAISNDLIDGIYQSAMDAGASGGKISGAGGGGFMFFCCPGVSRIPVSAALLQHGGSIQTFKFTETGLVSWKTN